VQRQNFVRPQKVVMYFYIKTFLRVHVLEYEYYFPESLIYVVEEENSYNRTQTLNSHNRPPLQSVTRKKGEGRTTGALDFNLEIFRDFNSCISNSFVFTIVKYFSIIGFFTSRNLFNF